MASVWGCAGFQAWVRYFNPVHTILESPNSFTIIHNIS
uniref:Uncharacterized protein n=1 Tax=Anguilla anguilla TaxID=7936 RepID=A0A0E9QR63_ANGAN